jgi:hypothetical protein
MTPPRRIFTEKRRLIWPIAIALLVNAGLFVAVVYPLAQKVAGGEQEAQAAASALSAARRDYSAAKSTVSARGQADRELENFYGEVLPPDVGGARRVTYLWIDQLARKCNLRLERQTADFKQERNSTLWKYTYNATLSGEYREIRRFIHELETAPEFLVLENVDLSQGEGNAKGGVNVVVQIATYYRTGGNGD